MSTELVILIVYAAVGGLFLVLGVPLWCGMVPRNRWYGFRTPGTLRSDRVWYPVNRLSGGWMIATGIFVGLTALFTYLGRVPIGQAVMTNVACLIFGICGLLLHGLLRMHSLRQR
ncbi:MAG: SdpI family protein [Planctomycetaceae bacterium]